MPSPVEVKVRVVMVTDQMAQTFDDIVRRLERIEAAQRPWWQRLLSQGGLMTNKRLLIVAGILLALCVAAGLAHAAELLYTNNAQSVTDTGVSLTITDNGSGGTTAAFPASTVFIMNKGANEVFCDVRDGTATTSDMQIDPNEAYEFRPSPSRTVGFSAIGCITSTGESTTIRVRAQGR